MSSFRSFSIPTAVLACLVAPAPAASAQVVLTVNHAADLNDHDLTDGQCDGDPAFPGNQCTLRAAFENANLIGGWVIIQIPSGTYPLSLVGLQHQSRFGDLDVYSPSLTRLDIVGAGMNVTTVDAQGLLINGGPERILHILSGVDPQLEVRLSDLTLANGHAYALGETRGGAIRHSGGTLVLNDVRVRDSRANERGGGICSENGVTLNLQNCFIQGNSASALDAGGGISLMGGARLVASSGAISDNFAGSRGGGVRVEAGSVAQFDSVELTFNLAPNGGGISNDGQVLLVDSFLRGNSATGVGGSGGAIENRILAVLDMRRSELQANGAFTGAGLNNSGSARLEECTVRGGFADQGAGISNTSAGTLVLTASTVSGNTANGSFGGGGLLNLGRFQALNSTFSGNLASGGFGGGIYFYGGLQALDLVACTVAQNQAQVGGGGIFIDNVFGNTPLNLLGTLIADNVTTGGFAANFQGNYLMSSAGMNLDSDGSCLLSGPGDLSGVMAFIGPLQHNGGPTQTHALLPGSPAIGNGSCSDLNGNPIGVDQRGFPRGPQCSIGAYEAPFVAGPANDDCSQAMPVAPGQFVSYDNCGATTDGPPGPCGFTGLPGLDSDVWFEFTMPADGMLVVRIPPMSAFEQLVGVYNGCPQMGGVSLGCMTAPPFGQNTLAVRGIAGQVLWVRVGGRLGACGIGTLSFDYVPSTGIVYCHGGASTPCPCGGVGTPGHGCPNSAGAGAVLTSSGNPIIASNTLLLHGSGMIPGQPALLFGAQNRVNGGLGVVFGDGLRCAGGSVIRLGVRIPNAFGEATWGPGLAAALMVVPGDTRRFQTWFRDPAGPCGSGFNLSHGYELTFY